MANGTGTGNGTPPPTTIRAAVLSMNPKIVLAFFLVAVAAMMVVWLISVLTSTIAKLDAGTIALFASFVTMFIKMASDGTGYQFSSSAGSDKKDDTQATVSAALADKVPVMTAALNPAAQPKSWWLKFNNNETAKMVAAEATDERVKSIIAAAKESKATPDDLAYLVTKDLLTPERVAEIQKP